jgi:hypothetical protein
MTWSLYNAFVLYKAADVNTEYREFVLAVLTDWIGPSTRITQPPNPSAPQRISPDGHFPTIDGGSTTDRRCVVCEKKYSYEKKQHPERKYKDMVHKSVKTAVRCTRCNVYLCLKRGSTCFVDYHTKIEYWR